MDFTAFRNYLESLDRSSRTVSGYISDLGKFATWFSQTNGETLSPENLTAADIRHYRQHMLTVLRAEPATINRHLAAIRAYSVWAIATNQITANPASNIKGIEEQRPAPRWLDRKQQATLLRTLEKQVTTAQTQYARQLAIRDKAIVVVALHTGMRIGEICALDLGDLEISERKGELKVRGGKGLKSRTLPLNSTARSAIREWLGIRPQTKLERVFIGKFDEILTPSAIQRRMAALGRQIGIELTPHRLRHTFCKNLIDENVSIDQVAALAAHKNIQTTARYTTPSQTDLENAVMKLEDT